MTLTFFTTILLPIFQTLAIVIGGIYLKKELHLKETQIDVLSKNFAATKELLSLYNVDEFRKNLDLRLENKNLEMKSILDEYGQKVYEIYLSELQNSLTEIGKEYGPKYKEFLFFVIEHIYKNKIKDIEVLFPLNKTDILELLEDIKKDF